MTKCKPPTGSGRRHGVNLALLLACALWPAARLGADEVHMGNQVYGKVSLRNFDGEFIIFVNADGESQAKKLAEVTAIFADSVRGLDEFNRAEREFERGAYQAAQAKYRLALPRSRGFWKNIIRVRHLMACDLARDLDLAVQAFVDTVDLLPDKADTFMPVHVADAPPPARQRALKILQQASAKASNQLIYWQLETLRLSILQHSENAEAGKAAGEIIDRLERTPNLKSKHRLQMIAVRVEVKHKQYAVALNHLNKLIADADDAYLPELLYLKGQCFYGVADEREEFIKAGLSFMRVIIHFPRSPFCARSMYWAGQVHEQIGRDAKALQLYQGCRDQPGADKQTLEMAKAAADQVRIKLGTL